MKHASNRIVYLILALSFLSLSGWAIKWFNPMQAGFPVVQNQAFVEELSQSYHRLPDRAKPLVRDAVWNLSQNSAGLAIHFYSNSPEIKIRYQVSGPFAMPHMPATGVSGVDLYRINSDGTRQFCFNTYAFGDTIVYTYSGLSASTYHSLGFEYQLYLPLYNGVKWMEIGVQDDQSVEFIPVYREKPIVLYGTSIAQGACASRPGMAWGNIVQRNLDLPLINLGFSGNGRLEKEVIDFINEIEAQIYLLDCLPNLSGETQESVQEKVIASVKQIREKHPDTPILLIEHAGYSNGEVSESSKQSYQKANAASRKAFEMLKQQQTKQLYYLSREELNLSADGWVDYVHPSDLGMQQQAKVVESKIREILHMPVGNIQTTIPVTQRREPGMYEWKKRHEDNLENLYKAQPQSIIIGNSITHYWGGVPDAPAQNGPETWKKYMKDFYNLGCGWDRIENVLWRIYHGELDGYTASRIILMIGTNNLDMNTDEEIVTGLDVLLEAIQYRQPKAEIRVIGILPRRERENRVRQINQKIEKMVNEHKCLYIDAGKGLFQSDGKINEQLFKDGLHPNDKGYALIAPFILKTSNR